MTTPIAWSITVCELTVLEPGDQPLQFAVLSWTGGDGVAFPRRR
ncbi:hypothetical protein ACIQI8_42665 [Streptomyces sp. NPDC092369]